MIFIYFKYIKNRGVAPYIPTPKITNYLKNQIPIELSLKESDFKMPQSARPLDNQNTNPITDEQAMLYGKNAGFQNEPIIADDVFDGKTFIWSNEKEALTVYSQSSTIKYSLNTQDRNGASKKPKDELIKISKEFLISKGLLNSKESSEFSYITFLKNRQPDGFYPTTENDADFYQVNFAPISGGKKILTLDPDASPINVWILPDGTITKAIVIRLGHVKEATTSYKLKNYQELVGSLNNATIVSLDNGNAGLVETGNEVKKITVNQIELVYLIDTPKSKIFQPVYLLKGDATLKDGITTINTMLYLPAISYLP